MTEIDLSLRVQQLLDYDHRGFIQALELNESSENNLKELSKLTNYYRQVIPVHILVSQSNRAKSVLVAEKYNYYKEDVKRLENVIHNVREDLDCINNKVNRAKTNQQDLINRVQCLVSILKNNDSVLSSEEIRYHEALERLNGKLDSFKSSVDDINSKLDAVKKYNEGLTSNKKWYFQEWQVELVKKNLFCMSDSIQKLLNEIKTVKEALNKLN